MKNISILGSTGSIGTQALDIIRQHPDKFKVVSLAANRNIEILKAQIEEFRPETVVVSDKGKAAVLKEQVNIEVLPGEENLARKEIICRADMVINSLVGKAGLIPTIEAIKQKKQIGLANKETLVLAGELVMDLAKKHDAPIIPIDSEHSALFQSLKSGNYSEIRRLILTMGKGKIAAMDKSQLENVSMNDVNNRPSWDMGVKINIDSATCMNKAFEVIEARWLFGVGPEKIDIAVHPQYICHSLAEFIDGSIITELGTPDMRRYIQYALFYPVRAAATVTSFIDLFEKPLSFEKPQFEKFPCLSLGHEALKAGGTMPAALHGADTAAAWAFRDNKIRFTQIPEIILRTMQNHKIQKNPCLNTIIEAEKNAEEYAKSLIEQAEA